MKTILPSKSDNILEFKNYKHSMKVPFAIYADFESVRKQSIDTEKIHEKMQKLEEKQEKTEGD